MQLDHAQDLEDRLVLLTGGGGILGSRFSMALARNGARIAILDSSEEKASAVANAVNEKYPGRAADFPVDITDAASYQRVVRKVEDQWGDVDVLINNAAAKSPNFFEPFETFPLEDWNAVMEVNLTGVMLGCQIVGAGMARLGKGSIINTLSIYGVVAPDQRIYEGSLYEGRSINTPAVYSASKAGVLGLTRYLSSYWGEAGVRVNALTPGGVFSGQNDTFVERYSARVPMGRMAEAEEMCGAMLFLASDASSYITGQNIIVDGGLTVW